MEEKNNRNNTPLSESHPEIAKMWDYERNDRTPAEVSRGSNYLAHWICPQGHHFQQKVKKKCRSGQSCPICSGHRTISGVNDFKTIYPELAKEWHPTKNEGLSPSAISRRNGRKVWWMCRYGHEWQATPNERVRSNTGCPECKKRMFTSFPEQCIYYYVKKLYPDAINKYRDGLPAGMELDIFIPAIRFAIEYDGAAWHNTESVHAREKRKYEACLKNGIRLCRIKEKGIVDWKDTADEMFFIEKGRKHEITFGYVIQWILNEIDPESNMWTRKNPLQISSRITVDLERDRNEILEYLGTMPNSLAELCPELVLDWNVAKNGALKPSMFGINSNECVWWKCHTCGHEWRTAIIHRAGKRKSGCPECAKSRKGISFTKRRVAERGSLAENNPTLAKEWHPSKNGDLTPYDVTEKAFKRVWWLCGKCGYEWESSVLNRSKAGCPCCSGRVPKIGVNDLETRFPKIAEEWDYSKNGKLRPEQFLPKSGKKVWWKCQKCGYEWFTEIRVRTESLGCKRCHKRHK